MKDHTNNLVERAFGIIKDSILHRCKADSVEQLAHFLSTNLPEFYARKLIEFANGRMHRKVSDIIL